MHIMMANCSVFRANEPHPVTGTSLFSQVRTMERKDHIGTMEKQLAIHSCSWAKTGTQLPPSFSAHLPTAQSVSLTPQRSQICWRSFSDCKNQRKAAPERCLSVRQASARVGTHLCCFPAEQEAPRRLSWSLPFQKSTCKTSSTWVVE